MGKWKDRRCSRRGYDPQRYMYQENAYYQEIDGPGASPDNVPTWEKKFCMSIGCVPWRKVLYTKKFMFGYDNILNWDDSSGEEAFQNAKTQFWKQINGRHCNIARADPDTYIEKINWNPHIDPELIKDLDRVFFNPDEVNKDEENESLSVPSVKLVNPHVGENPWESKSTDQSEDLKDKDMSYNWGAANPDDVNKGGPNELRLVSSGKWPGQCDSENPWESRSTEPHKDLKDKALSYKWGASNVNNGPTNLQPVDNPWDQKIHENAQKNDNPWEQSHCELSLEKEHNSWGQNMGTSKGGYGGANHGNSRNTSNRRFGNERRWRDGSGGFGFRKQSDQPRNGTGAWNNGCRKREYSQYNDYRERDGNHWSRGRDYKRVSLAP